jgi:hypothetical protein
MTPTLDELERVADRASRVSVDDPPRSSVVRIWSTIALIPVALFAVALRVRMMTMGRSLWLDETAIALNICGRGFAGLLKPLDFDQGAPIGFLWIERAIVEALGPGEFALRLFPFLASFATLYLVYRLCRDQLGPVAAVIGVGLAGVFPALFYYSGELKQYSSDAAVASMILVLAADALRHGLSAWRASTLAVVGTVAVWVSHPSVFVLAGAGTTLIVHEILGRRLRDAAVWAAVSALWLVSFAIGYLLFLKDLHANSFLATYWESGFLQFPPRGPGDLRGYLVVGFGVFEALFENLQSDVDLSMRMGAIAAAAWLVGVVALCRGGDRPFLGLMLSPLAFALVASMLHKYPLANRLALFTATATVPVMAAGIARLVGDREALVRSTGFILLACCTILPLAQGTQLLLERPRLHEARTVLTGVARSWRPGDVVVVDRYSAMPFLYYQRYGRVEGLDRVEATMTDLSMSEPDQLVVEVARRKGLPRVWFLLDTALPDPANLSRGALKVLLDQGGRPIESFSCRRYSAHLYQFDGPAGAVFPGVGRRSGG